MTSTTLKVTIATILLGLLCFIAVTKKVPFLVYQKNTPVQTAQIETPKKDTPRPVEIAKAQAVPNQETLIHSTTSSSSLSNTSTQPSQKEKSSVVKVAEKNSTPSQKPATTTASTLLTKNKITAPKLIKMVSDVQESYTSYLSPCNTPTGYKIGTFDTRFNISKNDFIREITQASSLWEKASGKTLFFYDEKATFTINLIYDERQASTDTINALSVRIDTEKRQSKTLSDSYEQEKITYAQETEKYSNDIASYQARQEVYKNNVATYNARGGANKEEYDAMAQELEALKEIFNSLEVRRVALNDFMQQINREVDAYNVHVAVINDLVNQSNALILPAFTEGKFSPSSRTIDIYQYKDLTALKRVLTHELGHALGINHTEDPNSIMYATNSATTTELTQDDIHALREVCHL